MELDRRTKAILIVIGIVISVVAPVVGETFLAGFYDTSGTIHRQTDGGLEVITTKDYNFQQGNPFTPESLNISTEANGWVNLSTATTGTVQVDEINGTWTNVSSVAVAAGNNLTIQPSDKNFTKVSDNINVFKYKEPKVNDNTADFRYTASGTATIVVETNATGGTAYGMVDPATNEGLDVAVADADGTVDFTEVPGRSSEQAVRIEQLGKLSIREETPPHNKITTATATIKFFEDEDADPTIEERTTNNGEIDLTGLPIDEQFTVEVTAPGYHNRSTIIDDLSQQETVFLLSRTKNSVENRFVVSDRTGDFPPENTEIIIEKAINRTLYGGSPDGFSWTTIGGDDLGADEAFTIDLEEEDRYRIKVRNSVGDTRILGAYTAETTGTINLNIGSVSVNPQALDDVAYAANRTNKTGEPVQVIFEYNDTTNNTTEIWLHIYEYGNQSNVLLANTSFTGPFGTFSNVQNVPSDENRTGWVVDFRANRDGGDAITGQLVVGGDQNVLGGMAPWLVSVIFIGIIWTTAGLFSQLNGHIGGIVVAALGAIMYFVGFAPDYLGGPLVALSLITAAILFIRERGGVGV